MRFVVLPTRRQATHVDVPAPTLRPPKWLDSLPLAGYCPAVESPGLRVLNAVIERGLWLTSLASACGLTINQAKCLISDKLRITSELSVLLSYAVGGKPSEWLEVAHQYDRALMEGQEIERAEEIPETLLESRLMDYDRVSSEDATKCLRTGDIKKALDWWIPHNQVFTMAAVIMVLDPLTQFLGVEFGARRIGRELRRRGYYCKQERLQDKQRHMVWRFNPCMLGVINNKGRKAVGVICYDDITEEDIKKYRLYKNWNTNLVLWLGDVDKFTIQAAGRILGFEKPDELTELRHALRKRKYSPKQHVWGLWRKDENVESYNIQMTGYAAEVLDYPGLILCKDGQHREAKTCQNPKVYRTKQGLTRALGERYIPVPWPPELDVVPEQHPETETVALAQHQEEEPEPST